VVLQPFAQSLMKEKLHRKLFSTFDPCWSVGWLMESVYSYASGDIHKDGASTSNRRNR
jgi:hypothetical protein